MLQALVTTLIVIVMVSGSAGVLFLVNGILAQVSELLFYK
jgi:preprotein translocase subunit SecE